MPVGAAASQPELETTGQCKTREQPWALCAWLHSVPLPPALAATLSRAGGCSPAPGCSRCGLCSRAMRWGCE